MTLPLLVVIPLALSFIVLLLAKLWRPLAGGVSVLAAFILLLLSISLVGQEPSIYRMGGWAPPLGINLVADGLSILVLLTISLISFVSLIFSVDYMERYTAKPHYYSLFLLMVAGMNGVVLSGDMFNLYVFLEIASIASYALVGFGCEDEELEASFKYLILGGVASTFILLGVGILYSKTGTLNIADISATIARTGMDNTILFTVALFMMGFGLKAAMVPFHAWLPDAHPSAPAPISAMLSGVLIKALGIYAIARVVFNLFGMTPYISTIMITLGVLSMVIGVFLAVGQWDFKRLLAYHSISQMGYVVVGLGLGTPLGIIGGLFHLINHAVFKSLLFLCSGSVVYATRSRSLKEVNGLSKKMPVTSTSCSIASLSISGVPPFNGFWSKLIIIIAAVQAKHYVLAGITVFVSFMTLVSFVKVQRYLLFGTLPSRLRTIKESPVLMCVAMIILAIFCIGLGISYPLLLDRVLAPARDVLLDTQAYIRLVGLGG